MATMVYWENGARVTREEPGQTPAWFRRRYGLDQREELAAGGRKPDGGSAAVLPTEI